MSRPSTPARLLRPLGEIALVVVGYALAFEVARAALHRAEARSATALDAQASPGMYAFAEIVMFLGVLFAAGALPTGAAFFFLLRRARPDGWLWRALSAVAIPLACTGLASCLGCAIDPRIFGPFMLLALARGALSPPLVCALVAAAFAAPDPRARRRIVVAAAVEGAASAYVVTRLVAWS